MPRKNKIIIRNGTSVPVATDFVTGEPAFNSSSGTFYVKNAAGDMVSIGLLDGNKGDITVNNSGASWVINAGAVVTADIADSNVTYAKLQNVSATDKLLGRSTAGAGVVEEITCTAAGRAILDDADAAAQRTTLGLGTIATQAASSVAVTGGAINGTTIGATTASTGAFTTVNTTGDVGVGTTGSNGRLHVRRTNSYAIFCDTTYSTASFGPREINDGFCTTTYSWAGYGTGNFWQIDAAAFRFAINQTVAGVSTANAFVITPHAAGGVTVGVGITPAATTTRLQVFSETNVTGTENGTFLQFNTAATSGTAQKVCTNNFMGLAAAYAGTGLLVGVNSSLNSISTSTTLNQYRGYSSGCNMAAGAGTLALYVGYYAVGAVVTSGSVTQQYGFYVDSNFTSAATNNMAYVSALNAASGRWNLHLSGTAQNYLAGNVGIGSGRTVPTSALDINGVITVTAGTVSAPALCFSGDTNTGIYSPGADQLSIATAGTQRLHINATGDVGIGTAANATVRLNSYQTATNQNGYVTHQIFADPVSTVSGLYTHFGAYYVLRTDVLDGVTDTGAKRAFFISAQRNNKATNNTDAGTLTFLRGAEIQYGHGVQNTAINPTTTQLVGLFLAPLTGYGTITDCYDLYIAAPSYGLGTVTNHWAMYQAGSGQKNYFAGNVGIGASRTSPASALDVNGAVTHALGSVGAPTVTFTGDSNTGIFSPGADQLAITTGGVERLRVASDGLVTAGGSPVITAANLLPHLSGSTASVDVYPRSEIISAAIQYGTSGNMLLVFFTPLQTVTVSQITMVSGTTAASGLTLAQMGLYTFDETTVTLVARCASNTTLFTTINTAYTRSLNTTGGYPATYTLQAGTRYGVALLLIGTTMPTFSGKGIAAGALALSPRTSYVVAGQTALPTTSSTFAITANHPFARLS